MSELLKEIALLQTALDCEIDKLNNERTPRFEHKIIKEKIEAYKKIIAKLCIN